MNKSVITNGVSIAVVAAGFCVPAPWRDPVLMTGMFAVSGAVTNWLAVYMLFERVPGLVGSGVIPMHFEDFKVGIERLIMDQFFTAENISRFFEEPPDAAGVDVEKATAGIDFSTIFAQLVAVVKESSFGGMLGMFGGDAALEPLKAPFEERMKKVFKDIASSVSFREALMSSMSSAMDPEVLHEKVKVIVVARLDELTPQMVKEIIQEMIRKHLGWLVVWGGVFGGLIGLVTSLVQRFVA